MKEPSYNELADRLQWLADNMPADTAELLREAADSIAELKAELEETQTAHGEALTELGYIKRQLLVDADLSCQSITRMTKAEFVSQAGRCGSCANCQLVKLRSTDE